MQMWNRNDANTASRRAISDVDRHDGYPKEMPITNAGVARAVQTHPGIFVVESKHHDLPPLILTGGMHGDEKAGIAILDNILEAVFTGKVPVKRHLLLAFGNLRAMGANNFNGMRCVEAEVGPTSNLNRCFGSGRFDKPRCYAEQRANEMMGAVKDFVETFGRPEALDIHQSFDVPQLRDVREGSTNRTEYTYAIAYPVNGDLEATLRWFHCGFSDIVAAVVVNDMRQKHHTFAGHLATTYGAHAATFEQGTIGFEDLNTFTPQLCENLARKIAGEQELEVKEGFDCWRYLRSVTKKSTAFRFFDSDGNPASNPPRDFLPRPAGVFARDGYASHELEAGERLLFANADVPLGDRAAGVIERLDTNLVPKP